MVKSAQQKGKSFEEACIEFLKGRMQTERCMTHRLYDTHSAGAMLPPQPGDCFHLQSGRLFLFEFKSSGEYSTLTGKRGPLNDLFSDDQMALMRMWHRAGAFTRVVFQCQKTQVTELWDGNYLAQKYIGGRTDVPYPHEDGNYFNRLDWKSVLIQAIHNPQWTTPQ